MLLKLGSDFEKEFHQIKDAREKRKKEHNENLAKCLKTMSSKIGSSIQMRVDDLIQANRRRQAYHDLNKIMAVYCVLYTVFAA